MMNKYISYSYRDFFLLFSCAVTALWRYVPFDGAGRFPLLLMIVSTILVARDLFKKRNSAILIYFVLTIFVFVNALFKGSIANFDNNGMYLIFSDIFKAPMVMLSMTVLFRKNFDKTLKYTTYIFLLFAFFALIFGSKETSYDGRYSGGAVAINELALYMTCCIDCLILLYIRRQMTLSMAILLALVPFALLILTASRTGLIMLVIFILGTIAISFDKRNVTRSVTALVALIIFLFAMNIVMENTMVGERLSNTTSQVDGMITETGTSLDYFGDRGVQYYFSWPYFLKNKWTGIGFRNWGNLSPTGNVVHSDYLYAYLENGIIAFFLYVFFIVLLFRSVSKKKLGMVRRYRTDCGETKNMMPLHLDYKQYQVNVIQNKTRVLLIVFLISVLAGAFATRIYSQPEIFIFYAMILALPYSRRYSKA